MGILDVDLDAEEAAFQHEIEQIEAWWKTPRHASLRRPYSARRVASLRASRVTPYPSSAQAMKLWSMFQKHHENGTYELTYGVSDTIMASEMVKYQNTVYVSGSLCGTAATLQPGADHADYPWDTVPNVVSRIHHSQEWNDQRQRQYRLSLPKEERGKLDAVDYLAPVIADGDMGFGPLTSTMKMAKTFVESGVAMIHVDDIAMGLKKFTIGQGRTLVPLCEYEQRLSAVRLQFDIMGADTMILSRSDCIKAQFITSVIDPRDHEYVLGATKPVEPFSDAQLRDIELGQTNTTTTRNAWTQSAALMTFDQAVRAQCTSDEQYVTYQAKVPTGTSLGKRRHAAREVLGQDVFFDWELPRSIQGQYMYQWCTKAVIERQLAVAPVADLSWPRMDYPDEKLISEIYEAVTKDYPGRLFCYGYTNSYDWQGNGYSYDDIKEFPKTMAKYGAVFQIQPMWASQGIRAYTTQSCKLLKEEGMAGYVEHIQKPALQNARAGSSMINHGAFLADAFLETIMARDNASA
ncbi:uncharacterized protein N7459_003024 [Penicillium hispanicum]|uniref:uncharacterized protein n=1 Tax=Penicillium hispanicum TaxID=1080232 RepID=UPI00253FE8B2|nr:uncharacterized protein N7459_003024 [Penicillium hispanicum]KAJ5587259.1 hypothetical protein N7459_003024 [Penicillium hispanicum]